MTEFITTRVLQDPDSSDSNFAPDYHKKLLKKRAETNFLINIMAFL